MNMDNAHPPLNRSIIADGTLISLVSLKMSVRCLWPDTTTCMRAYDSEF